MILSVNMQSQIILSLLSVWSLYIAHCYLHFLGFFILQCFITCKMHISINSFPPCRPLISFLTHAAVSCTCSGARCWVQRGSMLPSWRGLKTHTCPYWSSQTLHPRSGGRQTPSSPTGPASATFTRRTYYLPWKELLCRACCNRTALANMYVFNSRVCKKHFDSYWWSINS